jgi:putative DNA primase/helicase
MSAPRKSRARTRRADAEPSMLRMALELAREGFFVLPLVPGDKKPLTEHGYQDATTDELTVRRWWKRWPDANIGIALGEKYGLLVMDQDGPSGRDELARLEREYGSIPETLEATSGRQHRRHLYFRYPTDGTKISRRVKVNGAALDILVDGYVVAPPSIHPKTKRRYRWTREVGPQPFPEMFRKLCAPVAPDQRRPAAPAIGEVIPEGRRDDTLTSLAGTMRRRGMDPESILVALLKENEQRCRPPLSESQVKKIARSISKKPPLPLAFDAPINDSTLAERFAAIERDHLRYVPQWKKWLVWDGRHWAPDVTLEADRRAEAMVRGLFALLEVITDASERKTLFTTVNRYANHKKLVDVLSRARSNRQLVVTPDKLDSDPWLLNVDNGTLDLRTFELRPHDPADLITKRAPVTYDPDASAERWRRFIEEITRGDAELATYLQRAVGYTLVGVIREHVLFFCHGSGANGKSTFFEVLHSLFGDYAVTIDFETLLHHRYQSSEARRDLPRLDKARLVTANETPTNARWDERTIKQLTGGDTLSGRWLYQEKFEFKPTHTLWCRANDQPTVHDLSDAFWRRLRLVPFRRKFKGNRQQKDLQEQLLSELPGILNWALAGCRAWQNEGSLPEPQRVAKATSSYRQAEDIYGQFIEARCIRDESTWTETTELYRQFKEWWADTHGRGPVPSVKAFGKALPKQPGLVAAKRKGRRGWYGVALRFEWTG